MNALLERGADVDALTFTKNTALHWAAYYGKSDAAKALLAAGASLDAQNEKGKTPIDYARESSYTLLADEMLAVENDPTKRPTPQDVGLDMGKRNAALVKLGKKPVLGPQTAALKKVDLQRQRSIKNGEGI